MFSQAYENQSTGTAANNRGSINLLLMPDIAPLCFSSAALVHQRPSEPLTCELADSFTDSLVLGIALSKTGFPCRARRENNLISILVFSL